MTILNQNKTESLMNKEISVCTGRDSELGVDGEGG